MTIFVFDFPTQYSTIQYRTNHPHNFSEDLKMATKERLLKMTVMQHRNPKISEDEFNSHWTSKHAVIASGWLQRNGVLGYTQVHHICPSPDLRPRRNRSEFLQSTNQLCYSITLQRQLETLHKGSLTRLAGRCLLTMDMSNSL